MPHLTYDDCHTIQVLLGENRSHRYIARKLSRSNATISREIKKYATNGTYNAQLARLQRKVKRSLINTLTHTRITPGSKLHTFILHTIQQYWSPEQIAGVWNTQNVCCATGLCSDSGTSEKDVDVGQR